MPVFVDQIEKKVILNNVPKRIVSLVPSQTELLCDLGLEKQIVGVTKFCIHPKGLNRTKQIVGGTKNLRLDVIHSLKPDLIIANKEENEMTQVLKLKESIPVWTSDVAQFSDALEMIRQIGVMTGTDSRAQSLIQDIQLAKSQFKSQRLGSAIYLIWRDPYMAAGGDTFISDMMNEAGYSNCLENQNRYPQLDMSIMKSMNPEHLLLSTEPYPFKSSHVAALKKMFPSCNVRLVDGEMFSWYGSRLKLAFDYFDTLYDN